MRIKWGDDCGRLTTAPEQLPHHIVRRTVVPCGTKQTCSDPSYTLAPWPWASPLTNKLPYFQSSLWRYLGFLNNKMGLFWTRRHAGKSLLIFFLCSPIHALFCSVAQGTSQATASSLVGFRSVGGWQEMENGKRERRGVSSFSCPPCFIQHSMPSTGSILPG